MKKLTRIIVASALAVSLGMGAGKFVATRNIAAAAETTAIPMAATDPCSGGVKTWCR